MHLHQIHRLEKLHLYRRSKATVAAVCLVLSVFGQQSKAVEKQALAIWQVHAGGDKRLMEFVPVSKSFFSDSTSNQEYKLLQKLRSVTSRLQPIVTWDANADNKPDYAILLERFCAKTLKNYETYLMLSNQTGGYNVRQIFGTRELPVFVNPLTNGQFETASLATSSDCDVTPSLDTLIIWNDYLINMPTNLLILGVDSIEYSSNSPWNGNSQTLIVKIGGSTKRHFDNFNRTTKYFALKDSTGLVNLFFALLAKLNSHHATSYRSGCINDLTTRQLTLFRNNMEPLRLTHYPEGNSATMRAIYKLLDKIYGLPTTLLYEHNIYKPKF